jgi:hypothetical protein
MEFMEIGVSGIRIYKNIQSISYFLYIPDKDKRYSRTNSPKDGFKSYQSIL